MPPQAQGQQPIRVEIPELGIIEFPAGTSEQQMQSSIQEALKANKPDPTGGRSTTSRGVGGFITGAGLDPRPLLSLGAQFIAHPVDTAVSVGKSIVEPLGRLGNVPEAYRQGGMTGAANEAAASIPMIGPAAEQASQRWKSGDVAGGVGETLGLVTTPFLAPVRAAKSVMAAVGRVPAFGATIGERVAPTLNRMSEARIVETIAPKVGQNKVRFGNQAAEVAPRLAREEGMGAATRQGLSDKVGVKLAEHEALLDASNDARLAGGAYETAPVLADLRKKRQLLVAEAVEGSQPTRRSVERTSPILDERGKPITVTEQVRDKIGSDVVPEHNKARVAQIDKAIAEIEQLGPVARYEALRRIRQSYDGPAKAVYSPSVTADYMLRKGEKLGAADVTGALRDNLAKFDPETAKINPNYAFWRKVDDVMQAAEETERVRPSGARTTFTRATGAIAGAAMGHDLISMAAGVLVAEGADRLAASGVTTKVVTSRILAKLADDLRKGNTAAAKTGLSQFAKYAGLSSRLAAILEQQRERAPKPNEEIQ